MQILLAIALGIGCTRSEPARPSVLLVTLDTTRADRLGAYGYGLAQTPVLDRLAAEGALFERHSTTAPITLPAHISILTGLLPPTHGVRDNGAYALSREVETLPEHLARHGYDTRAWVSAAVLDARYDLDQGFAHYDDDLSSQDDPPMFLIRERPGLQTAEHVAQFLSSADQKTPFFAWMHVFDAHLPRSPDPRTITLAPTGYDAEVATADLALGRVIEALEDTDRLDDTIVVVTADHGEGLGDHGERTHAVFIYDSTMHVPLVVRYPTSVPAGLRIDQPTSAVDIVPTLLGLLDLPPLDTQGVDLRPTLAGQMLPGRDLYMESLLAERGFGMAPLTGLRRDDQVWIRAPRSERYDVAADPDQRRDLHPGAPEPGLVLDERLTALQRAAEARAVGAVTSPMSTETREMLMALGYLAEPSDRAGLAGMDPKDALPLHNLLEDARHAVRNGHPEVASAKLEQLLAEVPGHVSALNVLGLVRIQQGEHAEAEASYRRSLEQEPQQYRVLQSLARLAARRDDLASARALALQSLEVMPDFVDGMVLLGVIAFRAGDREEAERWHQRALQVEPDSSRLWRDLADLRYREERWDEARQLYERVTATNPRDFQAWLHAGTSALKGGDLAAARRATTEAATLRPDSWLPPYNLACVEARAGNVVAGLAQLELAIEHGLTRRAQIEADPDLAALRSSPGWARLVARLRPDR